MKMTDRRKKKEQSRQRRAAYQLEWMRRHREGLKAERLLHRQFVKKVSRHILAMKDAVERETLKQRIMEVLNES